MDSLPKQPVPVVTFNDVERVARREFSDDQLAIVITLLKECGRAGPQRESPRVQLAVLKLANGSLESLRAQVEIAIGDYRDVLGPAEYPAYRKVGFRIRELPVDERLQIIDSDWRQYEQWLRK